MNTAETFNLITILHGHTKQSDSHLDEPLVKVIWRPLCYFTNWCVDRSYTVYMARGSNIIDLNLTITRGIT